MKMHGLGNDFVVLDARETSVLDARETSVLDARETSVLDARASDVPDARQRALDLTADLITRLADRHRGVGFDQLAVIEDGLRLRFYNADGSTAGACGNATRCIARWLMERTGETALILTTDRGPLQAQDAGQGMTSVNMGAPQLDWADVPLARAMDTITLPIEGKPTATGMGNPHCTFFVDDVQAIDLTTFGPEHEHHPLFPQRTNVQVAQLIGKDHLAVRVWERGVGLTLASGSSSCAVAVAAARRGLTGRKLRIDLDGGTLHIDWRDDGVWMTGPTSHVFSGTLTQDWLAS